MKVSRIGILLAVVVVVVLAVEGALTVMRQRNLSFSIEVRDSTGILTSPQPTGLVVTPRPGSTPDPAPAVVTLPADGTVTVQARWDYRIGPTFPLTQLLAQAVGTTGTVVAEQAYTIDCGNASMECSGSRPLVLNFGIVGEKGTRSDWPAGDYTIRVTRRFGGLSAAEVFKQAVTVRGKP